MIDKVTIAADKMEEMLAFYSCILGTEFPPIDMFGRTLHCGSFAGIEILFCPKDLAGVEANTNTVQLRFVVDDVRASFECALSMGGTGIQTPQLLEGQLLAGLRDPDGNSIELKGKRT